MGKRVRSAPAVTRAREGDEKIAVTRASVETEESVGEHAAREVGAEGLLDVARQSALIGLEDDAIRQKIANAAAPPEPAG